MDEKRKDDRRIAELFQRLYEAEPKLESLWFHHRNDKTLERLGNLENFRVITGGRFEGIEKSLEQLAQRGKDVAFTDAQVERIKDLIDERAEVKAGRALLRMVGAALAGAATALVTYLGLKGH